MKEKTSEEKIFEAALYEFAEKGYTGASTNSICERAGVAKGLLFHYYKSKKNLYLAVLEASLETLMSYVLGGAMQEKTDLLEQIFYMSELKICFFRAHPQMGKILTNSMYFDKEKTPPEIIEKVEAYKRKGLESIRELLEKQEFRPGVDKNQAFEFILFTLQGYSNYLLGNDPNFEMMVDSFDLIVQKLRGITDFIKYGVYSS